MLQNESNLISLNAMNSIKALSPVDGSHLGDFTPPEPEQIRIMIRELRQAQRVWSNRPVAERVECITALQRVIMSRLDESVELISKTTGKVPTETLLGELYPVLEQIRYYEQTAVSVLARQNIETSIMAYPGSQAYVEQRPYGVVAIISPWNYPFQLSMIPALTALLAGNAVIIKPSELSLPVGELMNTMFQAVPELAPLVTVISGEGETGQSLIAADPDLIFFTGSGSTGVKVMSQASTRLIPLIMELGGKDALIALDDAPFERTVQAAVYGAFVNSGQVCISVERALVARSLHDRFVQAVVEATARLTVGSDASCDLGAMSSPRQIETVEAHYHDAIAKGAKASAPFRREGSFVYPVVLWSVTEDMRVWQEETFGPILPIMAFDHPDEAVALANASELGLNGSVFTCDTERGQAIARQLQVGGCAINEVIKHVGHPGLPFGGVKRSGFGRYRGSEGLRAFSHSVSIMVNTGHKTHEPNWFPYSTSGYADLRGFVDCMHGEGNWMQRLARNWKAMQSFRDYITLPGFPTRNNK